MKDNEIVYSYNRLLAQYKDMEKQMELKETEWKKIQKRYSVAEELARELCEMILAKDKAETGLGENYSWSSLDIIELIKKAKSSFQQYNANRAKLLKSLYKQSEDRRIALEAYMSKPIEKINSASPKLKTTVEQAEKMIDNPGSKAHIEALSDEFDNEDLAAPVAGVSGPSIKSTPVKHNNDDRKRKVPDKGSANMVSHYELTRNEADGILKELKPSEKILLQVFGDIRISIGNSSRRPAIISIISTHFERLLKPAKLPNGPTTSSPGPILFIVAATAVKDDTRSYPSKLMISSDKTNRKTKDIRNTFALLIVLSSTTLPSSLTLETALGCTSLSIS